MNISNTSNTDSYSVSNGSATNETKAMQSPAKINTLGNAEDTVNISTKGSIVSAVQSGLEDFRLPSWAGDFKHEFHDLSYSRTAINEAQAYVRMSNEVASDGHLSKSDRHAMKEYLSNNMPVTQHRKEVEAFYYQHKSEFNEYEAIHKSYVDEAKYEHGIVTADDYREKVLNAEGDNQSLRYSIMEKMLNNPRAIELMGMLGINKPT